MTLNPIAPGNYFAAGASSSARTKYVVGAAVEYALNDHWFAKAEYLYLNLGRIDQFFLNGARQGYTSSQFNQNHIFRTGLDYKLDASTPATEPKTYGSGEAVAAAEQYSAHGQVTWIPQGYPSFPALYSGPESLPAHSSVEATFSATAFLGLLLWQGAGIYYDPEIDQGFGVGNTFGVAGFPNGEVFKIGKTEPYICNQRYFLRQTIGLGGRAEQIEAGQNQLAGPVDSNRLTFPIGKYAVPDIFDDNKYAHDQRKGFMN